MRPATLAVIGTLAGTLLLIEAKSETPLLTAATGYGSGDADRTSAAPSARTTPRATKSQPAKASRTPEQAAKTRAAAPETNTRETHTGRPIDFAYGTIQLTVTTEGKRILAIEPVQVPSGDARTEQIAATAVPRLTERALEAQSADVDAVSGATYTSEGYRQALQSALDTR